MHLPSDETSLTDSSAFVDSTGTGLWSPPNGSIQISLRVALPPVFTNITYFPSDVTRFGETSESIASSGFSGSAPLMALMYRSDRFASARLARNTSDLLSGIHT